MVIKLKNEYPSFLLTNAHLRTQKLIFNFRSWSDRKIFARGRIEKFSPLVESKNFRITAKSIQNPLSRNSLSSPVWYSSFHFLHEILLSILPWLGISRLDKYYLAEQLEGFISLRKRSRLSSKI